MYHLHNNKSTKATNTNIIAETDHLHGIHIKDPFYCKLTETAYAKHEFYVLNVFIMGQVCQQG